MPPVLRLLGRLVCAALALLAVLAFVAFGVVLIAVRDPGERGAAVALMAISLALLAGAVTGLRSLRRTDHRA
jgi:hypothetical protein